MVAALLVAATTTSATTTTATLRGVLGLGILGDVLRLAALFLCLLPRTVTRTTTLLLLSAVCRRRLALSGTTLGSGLVMTPATRLLGLL